MSLLGRTLLALALSAAGCSATPTNPQAAGAAALATADANLTGSWKLQSFRSVTPLEPMLQAFVEFQYGNLIVRFGQGRFVAESPGVHVDRAYKIVEADGYRFHRGSVAFEADRARDLELRTLGYTVLRLSHRQITREPGQVVAALRKSLLPGRALAGEG